jgi:hypothetical protein
VKRAFTSSIETLSVSEKLDPTPSLKFTVIVFPDEKIYPESEIPVPTAAPETDVIIIGRECPENVI